MIVSMLKAWVLGIVILLIINGAWLIALQAEMFSGALLLVWQISPFVAALVSAYIAPRKKVILGTSMAVPAALIVVSITYAYQLFGKPTDFPGFKGGLILFAITLLYSSILCALGGALGYFITKKKSATKKSATYPIKENK